MGWFARHSEFYDFVRGTGHWRFTTDASPVVYAGQTYAPQPGMSRSAIVLTQELEKSALNITVPWDFALLDIYRPTPPSQRVTVTVYRLVKGATTATVAWSGVVTDIDDQDEHSTMLRCAGGLADLTTNGLQRKWGKACFKTLYSTGRSGCNKDPESVRTNGTLTYASGTTVKAAAFAGQPDGWFTGGVIMYQIGDATERRFIVSHLGDTLGLLTPAPLPVGQLVAAYPGCDHTVLGGCTKLANVDNYGGQLYLPDKNPMGGDLIF